MNILSGDDNTNQFEMLKYEIDYYVNLLRIQACETGNNAELVYQIQVQENKLHALGVNTENFKMK